MTTQRKAPKKKWTVVDDVYVIEELMNRYSFEQSDALIERIATDIKATPESLKMRIKNYLAVITEEQEGLSNVALASREAIIKAYKKYSKLDLYNKLKG
tara:strand:- start:181 stop:477 length:297 start_codon:yes stop_codon:yes gene_type:complete